VERALLMRIDMTRTALVLLLSACTTAPAPTDAAQRADAGWLTDAGSISDAGTCEINDIELRLGLDDEGSIAIEVEHEGERALLAIDTGSALTFLYLGEDGPEYIPDAGTVRIGCETLDIPGRNFEGEIAPYSGLAIVGVLGADFFVTQDSELDFGARRVRRFAEGAAPPEAPDASRLPFTNVRDHAIVDVALDGEALRLMLDTGSPDLLHVGAEGRPGDEHVIGQDVEGNRFDMYFGSGVLEMGADPAREVPVLRAPMFPYFEDVQEALGVELDGLLGVTSYEGRRLTFRPSESRIELGPVP
jgi:hypothetical protein